MGHCICIVAEHCTLAEVCGSIFSNTCVARSAIAGCSAAWSDESNKGSCETLGFIYGPIHVHQNFDMFVWSACLRFATASCGLAQVALQKFLGKRGVAWCPLPQSLQGQRHREDVRLARIPLLQDPSLQCMGCLPGRDTWSLLRKKHKQKHIYTTTKPLPLRIVWRVEAPP